MVVCLSLRMLHTKQSVHVQRERGAHFRRVVHSVLGSTTNTTTTSIRRHYASYARKRRVQPRSQASNHSLVVIRKTVRAFLVIARVFSSLCLVLTLSLRYTL